MVSHDYGQVPADFSPGDRVGTHPVSHSWLAGDRFGTVTRVGRVLVRVRLDSGTEMNFVPGFLRVVAP